MSGFTSAVALLTRVPMGTGPRDPRRLGEAVPWFPVVGAMVGGVVALVYAAATFALPPLVGATLATGAGLLVTGAFHEDGLGDTADALAGGWTRDERLRILRDPRLGTFGVSAVALSLLIRTSAVASLGRWEAGAALVAAHTLGRAAAIALMRVIPAATDEGLGASYSAAATPGRIGLGVSIGALVGASVLGILALPAALAAAAGAAAVGLLAKRRIGGITGDILGAAEQAAEIMVLLLVSAAVNGWAGAPWWR